MEIDPDPEKQRCEGILSATSSAGADVGSRVRNVLHLKWTGECLTLKVSNYVVHKQKQFLKNMFFTLKVSKNMYIYVVQKR